MLSFSYKKTNIDFIGDIPMHWNIVKLKFLSDIINGFAFSSQDFSIDNKIPVIRIGDINTNVDLTNCVCIEKFDEYKDFLIKKGDILFAMTGATIGKNTIYKSSSPSLLNQRVCIFRSKINTDQDFLGNCIRSYFFKYQVDLNCVGGAQANIGREDLMNFYVPYPPLNEQKLISQYLDKKTQKIDSLIKKTETKIELLKEQKTALINQFVTKGLDQNVEMKDSGIDWIGEIPKHWIVKKIGYVANLQTGNTPSKSQEDIFFTENKSGLPWVKPTDLNKSFGGVSSSELYLTVNGQKESRLIKKDSILICCIGNTAGKTSICNCDLSTNQQINSITFNKEVLPRYGLYYMNVFGRDLLKWMNFVTIPIISKGELSHQQIIIPPIEEQKRISMHLDEILSKSNVLKNLELKKINLLSEYRQSLISSVVTGKIRITEDMI